MHKTLTRWVLIAGLIGAVGCGDDPTSTAPTATDDAGDAGDTQRDASAEVDALIDTTAPPDAANADTSDAPDSAEVADTPPDAAPDRDVGADTGAHEDVSEDAPEDTPDAPEDVADAAMDIDSPDDAADAPDDATQDANDATDAGEDVDTRGDADAADADDDTADTAEPDAPTTIVLNDCDGPATISVHDWDTLDTALAPLVGDTVLRGWIDGCGEGSAPRRVRLRSACGGAFNVTLAVASPGVALTAQTHAPEVPGAEFQADVVSVNPFSATLDATQWSDLDASGDFELELELSCRGETSSAWSLVVDTPSTAPNATAANGWGDDLLPIDHTGTGCQIGDTLPNLTGLIDQHGNTDVALGQFAGELLIIEIGAVWCGPCRDLAELWEPWAPCANEVSPDFGMTVITTLFENNDYETTTADDLAAWSQQYDTHDPVLGGPTATTLVEYCNVESFPTVLFVDPNLVIRDKALGTFGMTNLNSFARKAADAWTAFRDAHPAWVSPRCQGVSHPGDACGCFDDSTLTDADQDHVLDACDHWIGDNPPPLPSPCLPLPGATP